MLQRLEANLHPLIVRQPVAFSEEMLSPFAERSPTAQIYLQAFKLVKQGLKFSTRVTLAMKEEFP